MRFLIAPIALLAIGVAGCVPDQDLDDWKAKKVDEEISKLTGMVGTYRGQLISERDGSPLGEVALELETDRRTQFSSGNYKPDEQAVLKGKLIYQGAEKVVLVFRQGFYDTEKGFFKATLLVTSAGISAEAAAGSDDPSSRVAQVELSGIVSGDTLEGAVEAVGFPDGRAQMKLTRGAASSSENLGGKLKKEPAKQTRSYFGNAKFTTGEDRPVQLLLLDNKVRAEEKFLDLLKPARTVQATFKLSDRLQVLFPDAEWDQLTGRLVGRAKMNRGVERYEFGLDCRSSAALGWSCSFLNNQNGTIATALLEPSREELRSPSPVLGTQEFFQSYVGTAGESIDGSPNALNARMTLLSNPLTPEEEFTELFLGRRRMQVGLSFEDAMNVGLPDTIWDLTYGTLSSRVRVNYQGQVQEIALDCVAKAFDEGNGWNCRYISTMYGKMLMIEFRPVELR